MIRRTLSILRKVVLVGLTLAAVGTIAAWIVSYVPMPYGVFSRELDVEVYRVEYLPGPMWDLFLESTHPQELWLAIRLTGGKLRLTHFSQKASRGSPYARHEWELLGFSFWAGPSRGREPPLRICLLRIPLWCPFLLFAAYPTIAFIRGPVRRWRRSRRRRKGLCIHCGYDLRGTPERCPECGEEA